MPRHLEILQGAVERLSTQIGQPVLIAHHAAGNYLKHLASMPRCTEDESDTSSILALPDLACAVEISVHSDYQGQGISPRLLSAMKDAAASAGYCSLVAPVRPTGNIPVGLSFDEYVADPRSDPWLRTHVKAGATVLKVASSSMIIPGSSSEWARWAGDGFDPEQTNNSVDGLLGLTTKIDRKNHVYCDPNVWVEHPISLPEKSLRLTLTSKGKRLLFKAIRDGKCEGMFPHFSAEDVGIFHDQARKIWLNSGDIQASFKELGCFLNTGQRSEGQINPPLDVFFNVILKESPFEQKAHRSDSVIPEKPSMSEPDLRAIEQIPDLFSPNWGDRDSLNSRLNNPKLSEYERSGFLNLLHSLQDPEVWPSNVCDTAQQAELKIREILEQSKTKVSTHSEGLVSAT